MPVSAGQYVREYDFTQYAPILGIANPAFVGGASKGPVGVPTVVSSVGQLVNSFGKPLLNDYGLQCAVRALNNGVGRITYLRVANNAVKASVDVPGHQVVTPASYATGTITFSAAGPSAHDLVTLRQTLPTSSLNAKLTGAGGNYAVSASNAASVVTAPMTGGGVGTYGSGSIVIKSLPVADTDNVTINGVVFNFVSGSSTGASSASSVNVHVDPSIYVTLANLVTQINLTTGTNSVLTASDITQAKVFEFSSDGTSTTVGSTLVQIGASPSATMSNLVAAINASPLNFSIAISTLSGFAVATFVNDVVGSVGNALITASNTSGLNATTVVGLSGGVDQVLGPATTAFTVLALNPGTWGNDLSVEIQQTTQIGITTEDAVNDPLTQRFDLFVYQPVDDGSSTVLVEAFKNLSLYINSSRYIDTVITSGVRGEVSPSQYISVQVVPSTATPSYATYAVGATQVGTDGVTSLSDADYIGTVNGQSSTGLQALRNPETSEFNLLAIPGVSSSAVINAVISLSNARTDFEFILDPPFGLSCQSTDPNNVVRWHNGQAIAVPNAPTSPIDNSHVLLYWPWVYVADAYNGVSLWLPPCGDVIGAHALSDQTVGPGWAVAGPDRGRLYVDNVEYSASQEDRDYLQGIDTTNRVNPIIIQRAGGAAIWGNRTCQRRRTALENASTRRGLTYVEKLCATATAVLLFDQNDSTTWARFVALCEGPLQNMVASRAFGSYKILCDASTNPPLQRQQKTLRGKIQVEAVDSAEIILLDFGLYRTGITFTENA